jgi:Uma2 family endonuclease
VFTDGVLLTNYEADISGNPDGIFFSRATLNSDRFRLIEGAERGIVEVQGTPDLVLEVVSESSVKKDLVTLQEAYWRAGITEYWVVDARKDSLRFDIFRHGAKGYRASPKKQGWMSSGVFGKSFRMTVARDDSSHPEYTLDMR